MSPFEVYAICIGGVYGLLALGRIMNLLGPYIWRAYVLIVRKRLAHPLIIARPAGSSSLSILDALLICAYMAVNAASLSVEISTAAELGRRSACIFAVNLVPLYLGGRTSLLVDKGLGFSNVRWDAIHRWMGRVCILQGLVHASCMLVEGHKMTADALVLMGVVIAIGVISILYLRRRFYELFLRTHSTLALGALVCLWLHITQKTNLAGICVSIATFFRLLQLLCWIVVVTYRNCGGRNICAVVNHKQAADSSHVVELSITLHRPCRIKPGQHFYLTFPNLPWRTGACFQAHPYHIAWYDLPSPETRQVKLFAETTSDFGKKLAALRDPCTVVLDGPYGNVSHLFKYDKIVLFASGIGVTAFLLQIRSLIAAYNAKSARVRRLSLHWLVETQAQNQALQKVLDSFAKEIDPDRNMLIINRYLPYVPGSSWEKHDYIVSTDRVGFRQGYNLGKVFKSPLIPDFWVRKEWEVEAGSMAVLACGDPVFERKVRRALTCSPHDIAFLETPFHPERTDASERAEYRCANGGTHAEGPDGDTSHPDYVQVPPVPPPKYPAKIRPPRQSSNSIPIMLDQGIPTRKASLLPVDIPHPYDLESGTLQSATSEYSDNGLSNAIAEVANYGRNDSLASRERMKPQPLKFEQRNL